MNDISPQQLEPEQSPEPKNRKWQWLVLAAVVTSLAVVIGFLWINKDAGKTPETKDTNTSYQPLREPKLQTEVVADGYSNIWDTALPDEKTLIFTERGGTIHGVSLENREHWEIAKLENLRVHGEGGLLGMTLDNEFTENRYGYICYNAQSDPLSVRVARFRLSDDNRSLSDLTEIITDIESQAGRHSGCRLAMGKDNVLWIGTGDSAIRTAPQDPRSLAGKVLRVTRDGKPAEGNLPAPFDSRIYSYGHRNVQGIVLFDTPAPNGAVGFTSEHGSSQDDEINWLLPGNFGWDPVTDRGGYDESVSMTDKNRYPDAIDAVWSSGNPTIAVSDIIVLKNERWQTWRNQIMLAVLKDKHVRIIHFLYEGRVTGEDEILNEFGRIRSLTEAPSGDLFITTDNGGGKDKIIRVIPE